MSINDITQLQILVIDDDIFIIDLCMRILNSFGCDKVISAENGKIGIDHLLNAREPIDIIISDLDMPEMDGFEFMQHLAENNYTGGLIFLSGKDDFMLEASHELAKSKKLNILGVTPKPLKHEVLKELLESF